MNCPDEVTQQEIFEERNTDGYRIYLGSEFVKCDYCGAETLIGKHLVGSTLECQKCSLSFNFKK